MKALIIEDERAAARNLKALLERVAPEIEPIAVTDSIVETIEWFSLHPMPDLVFMDIHLADGSSFEIFEQVKISCPVIFTTAYDEYALRAFKVNSIAYLLKPISETDLSRAIEKLKGLCGSSTVHQESITALIQSLKQHESYKTHFLIPQKGDKLIPLAVADIQFFHIVDGVTKAVVSKTESYPMPQTLDELSDSVDPSRFLRINRQYLISKNAVKDIDLWFNGRLAINLKIDTGDKILISKAKVSEFKTWFSGTATE